MEEIQCADERDGVMKVVSNAEVDNDGGLNWRGGRRSCSGRER